MFVVHVIVATAATVVAVVTAILTLVCELQGKGSTQRDLSGSFKYSVPPSTPKQHGSESVNSSSSRRTVLSWVPPAAATAFAAATLGGRSRPAWAASVSKDELARIRKGYDNIEYLLSNFDKVTTVCNPECKRNPDAVRGYLGLRSTEDPLFQIDRVLKKAQNLIDDPDDLERYVDAVEALTASIAMSNSMAYTSSFGEYNPGGGKDAVEKYLQLAKGEVINTQSNLKTIVDILGI